MTVFLKPDGLAGAQWRLSGEDDTQWRNSGETIGTTVGGVFTSGLLPGVYLVECKAIAGRSTPAISVPVLSGVTRVATATYYLADSTVGTPPQLLASGTVTQPPYAFVGQVRSDVGSATGFVVKNRVVATAAHVVFDDGTLSYVTGLQWFFQRDAGVYQPTPQIPRGFYVFDGYATQRTAEHTPGVSSPASQNLDVAAMYFMADAGRGGSSGFLASDSSTTSSWFLPSLNPGWLSSQRHPGNQPGEDVCNYPKQCEVYPGSRAGRQRQPLPGLHDF